MTDETKITYTATKRDINSWTPDGVHCATWDCGHKHQTIEAALRCLRSMGDSACSYGAKIEASDGSDIADAVADAHCRMIG